MKWNTRSMIELITILVVTVVVVILAVLQFRWTGAISQAEEQRLKVGLQTSVQNFNQEFAYDFERLCEGFEVDPEAPVATVDSRLVHQFDDWNRLSVRPDLLAGIYIWRAETPGNPAGAGRFETLDPVNYKFLETSWPASLDSLREPLRQQLTRLGPKIGDREALYYPWTLYGDVPALVRPLFQMSAGAIENQVEARPFGFVIVRIDNRFLEQRYLPEMVDRYFETVGLENFGVAIRTAQAPHRALYVSESAFPISASPDVSLDLIASVADEARRRGHPPLQPDREGQQWQLAVQHPAGSLEIGVADWRRRSLAISLGLLGVLAIGTVLIVVVARRAERLAKMQMEFVAGISHELCTPLAVINSAAENLVDGVVEDAAQTREYGGMIRDQGRRLERLVDQVLLFAGGKFGRSGYDLRPFEVAPLIMESLAAAEPMLREANFTLEREIASNLPKVLADPDALASCIENLLSNAVKYGGSSRWVSVQAKVVPHGARPEIEITVEDKGIGMSPEDVAHVFEPFYRSQTVRDGQIRGMGLGLYLVKRTMEGMGGRVTLNSALGHGARFSLYLPVAVVPESAQRTVAEAQT